VTSGLLGVGGNARFPGVGRNTYVAPGSAIVDFRVAREIKLSERLRWQLIAEAFNALNRINITSINMTQYNIRGAVLFPRTDFESISATGTNLSRERQYQLGTRFTF
jgi:D-mannonate dehydratase